MESCQKTELMVRVHRTCLTKGISQVAGVQLRQAAKGPQKRPSWTHNALWEPAMPGVRHERAPLTIIPAQEGGAE